MGWEDRNGRSYYYRKERHGNRVCSVYCGSGTRGSLLSRLDKATSEEATLRRILARIEQEQWQEQEAELDALAELMDAVATGMLLAAGYHTHKRQWRLKRHG